MKTLLVTTDFSPVSINAVNYAVGMALSIEASVVLMNAYEVPISFSDIPVAVIPVDEMKKMSEDKLLELKKGIEHITSGKIKVYAEARLGDPLDILEELCQHLLPFAVVMGSHGYSGWERLLMGSTTLKAIRHLTWPVIVVPPGTNFKAPRKIGLACDFKNVVESIPVSCIKSMVEEFGAELHVLNVDYNHEHFTRQTPLESVYLETLLGDIRPNYHFLNKEDIVDGINEFAETNNLDLIIVVPKKHKLLESLFHKSNSKALVTHSHIPIASIHE